MKVRAFLAVLAAGVWLGCASASSDVSDPSDLTVWPNRVSRANSDRWLVEHHDQLQRMNPRVLVLNFSCFLESLSHAIEGTAHSGAIPYFTRYFHEFAGFDLDKRHGLPWDSFYPLWGEGKGIEYPDPTTAVVRDGSRTWRLTNYVAAGGNVHFSPNGRSHYDLGNTNPVMSTIEDWRIGSGPGGVDHHRLRALPGSGPGLHGPVADLLATEFPGAEQPPARRGRASDEKLVAVSILLIAAVGRSFHRANLHPPVPWPAVRGVAAVAGDRG